MKAKIHVTLKQGILDPQGKAIEHALDSLGFKNAGNVRVGKYMEVDVNEQDKAKAEAEHLLDARVAELAKGQGKGAEQENYPVLSGGCPYLGECPARINDRAAGRAPPPGTPTTPV